MDEKNAKRILVEFEDGSTKEITKGFVGSFTDGDSDTVTSTFDLVGMSGKDLMMMVMSIIQLGDKLGLFKEVV